MLKLQYVKSQIKAMKKVQKLTTSQKLTKVGDMITAVNSCNELKKYLREHNYKNSEIRKFLSRVLGHHKHMGLTVGGVEQIKLVKCKIGVDTQSRYGKYYPMFLLTNDPREGLTLFTALAVDEAYVWDSHREKFGYNQDSPPMNSETFGLVRDWNADILRYNGSTKFVGEGEKRSLLEIKGLKLSSLKMPEIDNTLYLGVELEVGRKRTTPYEICKMVMEDLNPKWTEAKAISFAFMKSDSSIPVSSRGFEIVSAPATLLHHQTAWESFFHNSARYLRSYTLNDCGMHVHASRAGFKNKLHQGKFVRFYNCKDNLQFIEHVAGRKHNTYAKFDNNKKVLFGTKARRNSDSDDSLKYQAVNVSRKNTLEVRIFKGNCKREGFMKNIEFVHATIAFTRQASLSDNGLSSDNFLKWMEKPEQVTVYPYLTRWLLSRGNLKTTQIKLQDKVNPKNKGQQHLMENYLKDVA